MLHYLCLAMMYLLFMSSSGTVQGYDIPFGLDSFDDVDHLKEIIGTIHADFSIPSPTSGAYGPYKYAFEMVTWDGAAFFTDTWAVLDYLGEFDKYHIELAKYLEEGSGRMHMTNPTYYTSDTPYVDPLLAISGTVCEVEDSKECKVLFLTIEPDGQYQFVSEDVWCDNIVDCTSEPTSQPQCEDSDMKFILKITVKEGKEGNCDWLLTKKIKKQDNLCKKPAVRAACPATCGFCD